MNKIISSFISLEGKKRYVVALLCGVAATLALPPVCFLPLLFVACMGLFWLLQGCHTPKQAFYTGWWFGFGYFTTGIYWIAFALLTEPEKFGWMVPFAVFGLSGILALYYALFTYIFYRAPVRHSISKWMLFAVLWVVMEWLRTYLFTGFPWNLIGYAWTVSDVMMQAASVVGVYGIGLLTVLVATAPVLWFSIQWHTHEVSYKKSWPAIIALILLPLVWMGGTWRLQTKIDAEVPDVRLRIVQGNVSQYHKWKPELRAATLQRYISLTLAPGYRSRTHIIWPETAMPYFLENTPWVRERLGELAPEGGALVTGGLRTDYSGIGDYQVWNSMLMVNHEGEVVNYYDKTHLVPFGEYVPFRSILPLEKITYGSKDFSVGEGPRVLSIPNIPPFNPLICYEVIFPQHAFHKDNKPQWILNITNDAWFGNSSGPYQHFAMARMRAVEEGIPLVRAANTGISAVVDSYGVVREKINLGKTGVLDASLPTSLPQGTIYSRWDDFIVLALIAIMCSMLFFVEKRYNAPHLYP